MLTTDKNDPRLHEVMDNGQNKAYLVLSDEEAQKGYVRPLRTKYVHTVCGVETSMNETIAATYARDPKFYGATFCCGCRAHYSVSEFVWSSDGSVVGS